ncbi:MAG: hypothetical protein PVH17_10050 [Anaerolineae bacterium]
MAQLVVFVLDNLEQCTPVLDAWEEAGAPGVTILESTGLRRWRGVMRDDLPLFPSLRDLLSGEESRHRTLFTVVGDEAVAERIVAATEQIVGDFSQPNSGLLFVVSVGRVLGLEKQNVSKG